MKRNISLWQFSGFAVTSLLGTLLHYLYEWTNKSNIVAPFSGINESTWEHMKLLYYPLLLFALIQSRFFNDYKNFWCVKAIGIFTGLLLIPIIFYTYNGTFGKSPDWMNIVIFFVSAGISYMVEAILLRRNKPKCKNKWFAVIAIALMGVLFVIFTFNPPDIPLFEPPH